MSCSKYFRSFIAQRRILPKPTRKVNKQKQKRPRSRTLVAVHSAILDDLVYPAEIVGKRIRFRLDGSRLFKVHLDKAQQTNIEHKVMLFWVHYFERNRFFEVLRFFRSEYFWCVPLAFLFDLWFFFYKWIRNVGDTTFSKGGLNK